MNNAFKWTDSHFIFKHASLSSQRRIGWSRFVKEYGAEKWRLRDKVAKRKKKNTPRRDNVSWLEAGCGDLIEGRINRVEKIKASTRQLSYIIDLKHTGILTAWTVKAPRFIEQKRLSSLLVGSIMPGGKSMACLQSYCRLFSLSKTAPQSVLRTINTSAFSIRST